MKWWERIVSLLCVGWISYLLLTQKCASCGGTLRPAEYREIGPEYRRWQPILPVTIITNTDGTMQIKEVAPGQPERKHEENTNGNNGSWNVGDGKRYNVVAY